MEQIRKCIACGELKPKAELIKITREHKSGDAIVQPNSKTFGRSVYLCYNKDCIDVAFKKNKLSKMLKTNTSIEKEMMLGILSTNK